MQESDGLLSRVITSDTNTEIYKSNYRKKKKIPKLNHQLIHYKNVTTAANVNAFIISISFTYE